MWWVFGDRLPREPSRYTFFLGLSVEIRTNQKVGPGTSQETHCNLSIYYLLLIYAYVVGSPSMAQTFGKEWLQMTAEECWHQWNERESGEQEYIQAGRGGVDRKWHLSGPRPLEQARLCSNGRSAKRPNLHGVREKKEGMWWESEGRVERAAKKL